jgi:hypothetical protein
VGEEKKKDSGDVERAHAINISRKKRENKT